jgi:indole-3-glycerol phosphate synthase
MTDFLQSMAVLSAERAAAVGRKFSSADFDKPVLPLQLAGFDVIAEIKDRSPAEGDLATGGRDRGTQARSYAAGGAAAISVLTEPSRFSGSLAHLEEVVATVPDTPVMRKDFLVAPAQIDEARVAGASGVLLIATMLADNRLREMLDVAYGHGLFVLLESFDADDLDRAAKLLDNSTDMDHAQEGQLLYGINTRNLRTLHVDPDRLKNLAPALPQARCVAESGLHDADDAAAVAGYGYSLALVGTALMRSDDPAALVSAMRVAGSAQLAA